MTDPRLATWAHTLVNYSTKVKPGDVVSIEGDVSSRPLLHALYREALKAGGRPVVIPRLPEVQGDLLELGSQRLPGCRRLTSGLAGPPTSTSA